MRIFAVVLILFLMCLTTLLSATPKNNKSHKGKVGKDGARVTCTYCHSKAKIPKTRGNNIAELQKNEYCAIKGCHLKEPE